MNTLLQLIPEFLRVIAGLEHTNHILSPWIEDILVMAANLIERGEAATDDFKQLNTQIKNMVAANRAPTDDEWDALKARSNAASTDIQAAAKSPS